TTIVAFGDSMTEGKVSPPVAFGFGWTLPPDAGISQSYPFKLKALLEARYTTQKITVINAGWSGRQAREDESRFRSVLSTVKPDLVLLMEGANDLIAARQPGEGDNARVRSTVDALEEMVREAVERRGIPLMIATLPPQRPGTEKALPVHMVPLFNDALPPMASRRGGHLVDIGSLPLSFIGQDGLHPSEAGYQRIAELWMTAIRSRHEKASASAVQ
ncbi:MAG TPA: GDSL-type esterase/lipase family protein, partial [Vicinamibacterales bacterium]|nr:GDSL-type esterase/lipase family protein [Vicinamibacterales bacterium]